MLVRPKITIKQIIKLMALSSVGLALSTTTQLAFAQSDDDLFNNIESESFLQDSQIEDPFSNTGSEENGAFEADTFLDNESNNNLILNDNPSSSKENAFLKKDNSYKNNSKSSTSDQAITNEVNSLEGQNKPKDTKRVKFIKHPGQKQGLYKISADGKYYYKVEESEQKYGLALKGGAVVLNQLQNPETNVTFNSLYNSSAKGAFFLEYYYSYFKNKNVPNILKKARVKYGSGLIFASGNGSFTAGGYEGVNSRESFTFLAFPNHLGLHLSLEVKDKQLVVPFVTGAFEYIVGIELQNGNFGRTKVLGQLGAHVGGGLALSLGWLDEAAKFDLDHEFGINQTFLTFELRQNIALQQDFNFTATFLNVGIQLEF